jgi:hypothetical protein
MMVRPAAVNLDGLCSRYYHLLTTINLLRGDDLAGGEGLDFHRPRGGDNDDKKEDGRQISNNHQKLDIVGIMFHCTHYIVSGPMDDGLPP